MDQRSPRDGRVIEELGHYDPMCPETDARVVLKAERVDYWLGVGAQPSDKVKVLIKKYGTNGTHLDAQQAAMERLGKRKDYVPAPAAPAAEKPAAEKPSGEKSSEAESAGDTTGSPDASAEGSGESAAAEEAKAGE